MTLCTNSSSHVTYSQILFSLRVSLSANRSVAHYYYCMLLNNHPEPFKNALCGLQYFTDPSKAYWYASFAATNSCIWVFYIMWPLLVLHRSAHDRATLVALWQWVSPSSVSFELLDLYIWCYVSFSVTSHLRTQPSAMVRHHISRQHNLK